MRSAIFWVILNGMLGMACSWQTAAAAGLSATLPLLKADRVIVLKSKRQMILMRNELILKIYPVSLGRYPKGHKQFEGDARTPEGEYLLDSKLEDSHFYRAIRINYPNARDIAYARAMGKDPGGKIMIHGLPNTMSAERVGHTFIDWTQGCIAVTNSQMDEIWQMVDAGTPIKIHP